MNKLNFKSFLPHLIAIVVFITISAVYFNPILSGKALQMGDIQKYKGMSKEVQNYYEETGERPLWTNQMFGGMPTYQISVKYASNLFKTFTYGIAKLMPFPLGVVFLCFLGFYLFLITLGVKPYTAMVGALAFGFSSYTFTIIEAGHVSKAYAIAYMAPILSGIVLTMRGKLVSGGVLAGVALALQLGANHFQITFYTGFAALILIIVYLSQAVVQKQLPQFLKASGILVVAVMLAGGTSMAALWSTYEYGEQSIRGKSELTQAPDGSGEAKKSQGGLDAGYVTNWSYGISETWSLMVPDFKGGASGAIGNENKEALKKVKRQFQQSIAGSSQYFGNQPFTSGPFYFGALVIFLFVLGLFLIDKPLKWAILGIVGLSMFLSWGKNYFPLSGVLSYFFMVAGAAIYTYKHKDLRWPGMLGLVAGYIISILGAQGEPSTMTVIFGLLVQLGGLGYMYQKTKVISFLTVGLVVAAQGMILIFILSPDAGVNASFTLWVLDNVPLYNKFRTVSMTLVMAQVVMPILAFMALDALMKDHTLVKKNMIWVGLAFLLTGGACFWFYVSPHSVNDFFAYGESNRLMGQLAKANFSRAQADQFIGELSVARTVIFQEDSIRSAMFILGGLALIMLYGFKLFNRNVLIAGFAVLVLLDMWNVDRRYVNDENFVSKRQYETPFQADAADLEILKDQDIHYRVYNSTRRPDQDGATPFFHKSIGGYHAAKLRRIQDVITHHLLVGNQEVLHMLNTKYVIVNGKQGREVRRNFNALGNAWFVKEFEVLDNADQELASLKDIRAGDKAVLDQRFSKELEGLELNYDPQGSISLLSYHPEKMKYQSKASSEQLAVFSEVYYDKGWNAYIDGEQVPYIRVDYLLRGLRVPAGEHAIEFRFEPVSYRLGEIISLISSLILLGSLAFITYQELKSKEEPA